MIPDPWSVFRGRRILLLQGPVGPFFWRLSKLLRAAGATVYKVNFNGGDCLFYPRAAISWRRPMQEWPKFFESLLGELRIDIVILFGDCRPIHRVARKIAWQHGVNVGAFEEGYVRPNFITFERFGVNGYSLVPRRPDFYAQRPAPPNSPEREVGYTFWWSALWAALYYLSADLCQPWFSRYTHHRPLTIREAGPWIRAGWRKLYYRWMERKVLGTLTGNLSKRFFLVPLQISCDSQVSEHSRFNTVADFVRYVVASFAAKAPRDVTLVIKHHPLDKAYHDYGQLIRQLAAKHALEHRLLYIHDQHLPTLFNHMRGAVVINSTVGFSALAHHAPLKTLGVAIYDFEGLTFQGPLDDFWHAAEDFRPDSTLAQRFRAYLIAQTQINGSCYTSGIDVTPCASMLSVAQATRRARRRDDDAHEPSALASGAPVPRLPLAAPSSRPSVHAATQKIG